MISRPTGCPYMLAGFETTHSSPIMPPPREITLADLMTMVPDLHLHYPSDKQLDTIKSLRLVCKEVCDIAQTGVQSFSLPLGQLSWLAPRRALKLLQGAQLKQLTVTVTFLSGGAGGNWVKGSGFWRGGSRGGQETRSREFHFEVLTMLSLARLTNQP